MRASRFVRSSVASLACVVVIGAATSGCKPDLLPGSKLEDTPENRAIVDFMNNYKKAVEARSADAVLALVAEDFFEDGGTPDEIDDYGIEKLRTTLARNFSHTKVVQLRVDVQHVELDEHAPKTVRVFYRFLQRALLTLPAGNRWVSHSDVNRVVLRQKGDSFADGFLIVSGL